QKIMAFIAPKIIGGTGNYSPIGDLGLTQMTDALGLREVSIEPIAEDLLITGYLSPSKKYYS
ncbi:MAG: bifunctional diaminohydroxyphosphoribosylaminopyrimidine deaminase/5-amino-6-(5-phosphoribosylamino)uracil reductase, partial [Microcystaceae cyanobacterium]